MSDNTSKLYTIPVTVADRYSEGHQLTANEAKALNGLRRENIGHGQRIPVAELIGDTKGFSFDPENPDHQSLQAQVQGMFDTAAQTYEFGQRVGGGRSAMDPVTAMARQMARQAVNDRAAEMGVELTREQRAAAVNANVELFRKAAEKFVKDTSTVEGKLSLDLG